MPEIKLKPCPFCGSENVLVFCGYYYADCIVCTTCKAKFQTDKYLTDEQLSEAWNKRAEPLGRWINENADTIECSNCHHVFDDSILLNADEKTFWDYPKYCPNCGAKMDEVSE